MDATASDLSRRLSRNAEAVCRTYLPSGHREGRYWIAGDVTGSAGRSLYVRLQGKDYGKGAAGKWTDAATGEHGDLLDLIGLNLGHAQLRDTLDEARRFLALPLPPSTEFDRAPAPTGSRKASMRLWAASRSLATTLCERYLRGRSLDGHRDERWLRFHPHCWYRPNEDDAPGTAEVFPALIAAITDGDGTITGVHRTWLDPTRIDKAAIATPRKAMGDLLGHGVRFGFASEIMAAGEGLETILSLRTVAHRLPSIAALSSAHLAALAWPKPLRSLYVVRDADAAGDAAWSALSNRAKADGIELIPMTSPIGSDLNDALRAMGRADFFHMIARQMHDGHADRLLAVASD